MAKKRSVEEQVEDLFKQQLNGGGGKDLLQD